MSFNNDAFLGTVNAHDTVLDFRQLIILYYHPFETRCIGDELA